MSSDRPRSIVTFFSTPKAFAGHIDMIQRNALQSWKLLGQEVILIGDDEGVAEAAQEFSFRHLPNVARTEAGTPRVDAIFASGTSSAMTPVLCFVNADIILDETIVELASALAHLNCPALAIGERLDTNIEEVLSFPSDPGLRSELVARLKSAGISHGPTGIDYFLFTDNLWQKIPPFALGRGCWDNWLIWRALRGGALVIDASTAVTALHQDHDYGHLPGGKKEAWEGAESLVNIRLAGGYGHMAAIPDATHRVDEAGNIVRMPRLPRIKRSFRRFASRLLFVLGGRA